MTVGCQICLLPPTLFVFGKAVTTTSSRPCRAIFASRGEITPPTILRTAPFGAMVKRVGVHLVDHTQRFLTHFDVFDQGTKDRTARVPIRFAQAIAHTPRECLQLLH